MKIAFVLLITPVRWVGMALMYTGMGLANRGLAVQKWVCNQLQNGVSTH